jgi:hypothetical protein
VEEAEATGRWWNSLSIRQVFSKTRGLLAGLARPKIVSIRICFYNTPGIFYSSEAQNA